MIRSRPKVARANLATDDGNRPFYVGEAREVPIKAGDRRVMFNRERCEVRIRRDITWGRLVFAAKSDGRISLFLQALSGQEANFQQIPDCRCRTVNADMIQGVTAHELTPVR